MFHTRARAHARTRTHTHHTHTHTHTYTHTHTHTERDRERSREYRCIITVHCVFAGALFIVIVNRRCPIATLRKRTRRVCHSSGNVWSSVASLIRRSYGWRGGGRVGGREEVICSGRYSHGRVAQPQLTGAAGRAGAGRS